MSWLRKNRALENPDEAYAVLAMALANPAVMLRGNEDRTGVYPAGRLAEFYGAELGPRAQVNLGIAAGRLLQTWTRGTPPSDEARNELIYFLAKTRPLAALGTLQLLIEERVALQRRDHDLHVRFLAALLDFQEALDRSSRKDARFWMQQFAEIGERCSGVVWSGLLQWDPDEGFARLPQLVRSKATAMRVRHVFPWVARTVLADEEEFVARLQLAMEHLPPPVREVFTVELQLIPTYASLEDMPTAAELLLQPAEGR